MDLQKEIVRLQADVDLWRDELDRTEYFQTRFELSKRIEAALKKIERLRKELTNG